MLVGIGPPPSSLASLGFIVKFFGQSWYFNIIFQWANPNYFTLILLTHLNNAFSWFQHLFFSVILIFKVSYCQILTRTNNQQIIFFIYNTLNSFIKIRLNILFVMYKPIIYKMVIMIHSFLNLKNVLLLTFRVLMQIWKKNQIINYYNNWVLEFIFLSWIMNIKEVLSIFQRKKKLFC